MHARLGFALAVNLNPDVLLVDEVVSRWRRSISREMCKADSEVSGGRKNNYFRFACW
jgi:ABC-type polysaccharide/polyol phosphate transport system ATPase subunit